MLVKVYKNRLFSDWLSVLVSALASMWSHLYFSSIEKVRIL